MSGLDVFAMWIGRVMIAVVMPFIALVALSPLVEWGIKRAGVFWYIVAYIARSHKYRGVEQWLCPECRQKHVRRSETTKDE